MRLNRSNIWILVCGYVASVWLCLPTTIITQSFVQQSYIVAEVHHAPPPWSPVGRNHAPVKRWIEWESETDIRSQHSYHILCIYKVIAIKGKCRLKSKANPRQKCFCASRLSHGFTNGVNVLWMQYAEKHGISYSHRVWMEKTIEKTFWNRQRWKNSGRATGMEWHRRGQESKYYYFHSIHPQGPDVLFAETIVSSENPAFRRRWKQVESLAVMNLMFYCHRACCTICVMIYSCTWAFGHGCELDRANYKTNPSYACDWLQICSGARRSSIIRVVLALSSFHAM